MLLRRLAFVAAVFATLFFFSGVALADKVAVLPFHSSKNVPRPELEEVRKWTKEGVTKKGHTLPSDSEMVSAEMAVKDGIADVSTEYRAAGRASGAQWALGANVERIDYPPSKGPDGKEDDGYTTYRIEIEACQVDTGRVESLAREIIADDAPDDIAEMIGILVRPEGIANASIPWEGANAKKPKPKPKPPPPPAAPPPPPPPPPPPARKYAYAEGHPIAVGLSIGLTNAIGRPDNARGPSWAMPIGAVGGYAIDALPGLELRGIFTSQVVGPKAIEIAGGARYAFPIVPQIRLFAGPELLIGPHIAIGADKTARFITHGSAFVALGLGEQFQIELAGDLAAAFGGAGTLVLGGGTLRGLARF